MYLESTIVIERPPAEVWAFFEDPRNLAKWDRSVEISGSGEIGVGYTFETYGPATKGKGVHSSYRISEYRSGEMVWVDLTNSQWFKEARWLTAIAPSEEGTKVTIGIKLEIRLRYFYLWPILRLSSGAIRRDLGYLKSAIEAY